MAHLLVALSLAAGLAIGLWAVVAIPPQAYPYLVVAFLVCLDGLLFSLYRLRRGERVWMLLFQRMSLHSAYAFFILLFATRAERDMLMLATIPLGFSVFLNLWHLFPGEGFDSSLVRASLDELSGEPPRRQHEALPVPAFLEAKPVSAEPATGMTPAVTLPGAVTTFTVTASTTPTPEAAVADAPDEPAPTPPPAPKSRKTTSQPLPSSPFEP